MEKSKKPFNKYRRGREKVCFLCKNKLADLDYKDGEELRKYINEKGKILPRRATGTCNKHQRVVSQAIKKARAIAILPYSAD